jgi:peptidase E
MTHRKRSVELVAEMLDITPQEVSPLLLKVFIFLHEAGHALDYIQNFMAKEVHCTSKTPKANATAAWSHRFETEMNLLPVPNITPSGLKAKIDFANEIAGLDSLNDLSTNSEIVRLAKEEPQALLREQEEAYKAGESEQRADAFAVAVIQRHKLIELLRD